VANNRVFYAITAVGIGPHSGANAGTYTRVRGLQSATITTNYNLEAAYELGMLSLYQNIEGVPEIEVQLERVLDGTPLMFDLATSGRVNNTLIGRANSRCNLVLSVHADTAVSASGTPVAQCLVSGAYASAISFKSAMDGNATESMTVVGNNKIWASGGGYWTPNAPASEAPTAASGIVRRQHVLMDDCIFPKVIPGVNSGTGKLTDIPGSGYSAHIQSVSINCNLGREQLMELGRKGPFFRYVKFPVEVTPHLLRRRHRHRPRRQVQAAIRQLPGWRNRRRQPHGDLQLPHLQRPDREQGLSLARLVRNDGGGAARPPLLFGGHLGF